MNKEQHRPNGVVTQFNHAKDNTFFEDAKKEKTMVMGMPPDMKEFYLEFKKNNPGRESEYYQAFVKLKREENQKRLKEEEDAKRLARKLAQSASFWQLSSN